MVTKSFMCWILLVNISFSLCERDDIPLNEPCKVKYLEGTCQRISSCKIAITMLRNGDSVTVKSMFCGFEGSLPKVCCPKFVDKTTTTRYPRTTTVRFATNIKENEVTSPSPTINSPDRSNVLPSRDVCGQVTGGDKIFGGRLTDLDEFPWLARLKFFNPVKGTESYICSGSLISDRYVLTAAHCIGVYKLVEVRLGEWDAESDVDCNDGICSDPPIDVKVDKVIIHPNYNRKVLTSSDIALLRLAHPVKFTDFIQPICLPTSKYIARQDYIDSTYTTAGWGTTDLGRPSAVKLKVALNAVSYSICRGALFNLPENNPNLICAGGREGEDTCLGDSGGPLARIVRENYKLNWYLYGITSYGVVSCGSAGKPSIYTRVSSYMDWILDTISAG